MSRATNTGDRESGITSGELRYTQLDRQFFDDAGEYTARYEVICDPCGQQPNNVDCAFFTPECE